MAFTERHVNELCGAVVESCGSEDYTQYQILEDFVNRTAFGPYDQTQTLAKQVQETICEADAYRIRRAVRQLSPTNPAAREIGGTIFEALGFQPKSPHGPRRINIL